MQWLMLVQDAARDLCYVAYKTGLLVKHSVVSAEGLP